MITQRWSRSGSSHPSHCSSSRSTLHAGQSFLHLPAPLAKITQQQRMTFVQARIDEVRESFRGRQTSTRGRRRGRPRKRPNDDLDEWTPDRPRAVRGRKRGRPPAGAGRGRQTASLSPVRKAPRGRGRVANERHRPGPKPKLEGPGPPPAVITPGGKCFVCSKAAGSTGSPLTALTNTTKVQLHQKLGRVVGAELDLIVDEDGVLCHGCCRLLNYMDRIEVEHSMLTKSILNCMRRTFGFGYVQGDNRMPEAVLASIEDYSKNSIIPVEKQDISPDVPEKATSDPILRAKTLTTSDTDDKKKNQTILVDKVPEKKTDAEQDKKNYHCKICNFESKHKSVFLFHLQRHLQSSYRCDFCNALLPKGFKILEPKNTETTIGETVASRSESVSHTEAAEVQVTKEVKDYVETMIEELHTTGIVTTMKPVTPEKFKSSSEIQLGNVNTKETVVSATQDESRDASIIYEPQGGTGVEQGTLNILLTFPNERRQSISVHHDVPVENNFTNDVVTRQLRDIFGNFSDEPVDVEDKADMHGDKNVETVNAAFVKTVPDVPLLENSPVSISSKNGDYKQDQNEADIKELSVENADSVTCADEMDIQPENTSCIEDTEEKYQKQLALLDEMGLIMLPKRSRPSAHEQSADTGMKENDNTAEDRRDQHWDNLCDTENNAQSSQEHESDTVEECELEVLKEERQWLPESLNRVETTAAAATADVTTLVGGVAQLQSVHGAENGNEWLKSNVTLINENTHWLHQTDSNTTTNGNSEITVWTEAASLPGQQDTLTATESERTWLLSEDQISEPMCTNMKKTEIGGVNTTRDTPVWDSVQNGNADSCDDVFRRCDDVDDMNSDSSPRVNNGGDIVSAHTVPETEVTKGKPSFLVTEEGDIAESSPSTEQCVTVHGEVCNENVTSLQAHPAVQSTDRNPSSIEDVTETEEMEVVVVSHQNESSTQEQLSAVLVTDSLQFATGASGQVVSTDKQDYTEDTASADSCGVKQFDFQTSEMTVCSAIANTVDSEAVVSNFNVSEGGVHTLKEKGLDDMDSTHTLMPQSEHSGNKSDVMKLVEGQSDDAVDESSTEPNFESIKR